MSQDDNNGESSRSQKKTDSQESNHAQTIASEKGFQEALRALVLEADGNGVDVRGGWPIGKTDGERAWDIEITRVSRRSTTTIENAEFPASAIADAVAEREGVEPTELPPLYDAIGPDILEVIHEADTNSDQRVTFDYVGYTITVSADGTLQVDG